MPHALEVVDSHTEGEPTRVVVSGFPELQGDTLSEKRADFRARFDHLRKGLVCEPRGHEAIVGALLLPACGTADAGVIFFNDVGYLGMCGHGTIGVAETLRYLGRARPEGVTLETPVGTVEAKFEPGDRDITIRNVPARTLGRRRLESMDLEGEVAYGGNWFFFIEVEKSRLELAYLDELLGFTKALRMNLLNEGITGDDGAMIDHIELYAPISGGYRNFVLCPGSAYDRSPCGTGTSAKLACLAEAGELEPGEPLIVESITGSRFTGRYERQDGRIVPFVTGRAFVTGRFEPIFDPADPFAFGF